MWWNADQFAIDQGPLVLALEKYLSAAEEPDQSDDFDRDGVANESDDCPYDANPDQADSDGDGIGDVCEVDEGTTCCTPPCGAGIAGVMPLCAVGFLIMRSRRAGTMRAQDFPQR